jgi:hypothetical protein
MKKITAIVIVCWCTLLSFSCEGEDKIAYATVTVYNQSDFDVTELTLYFVGGKLDVLEKEKEHKFNIQWAPGSLRRFSVCYNINGEYFYVDKMEGALYSEGGQLYYSPYLIKDGAKAFVYIKNEGYKVKIEGGDYSVSPENPGSPH